MFDDHDGVADVAETLQHPDQPVGVPRMETDAGFVEDVHRAGERTSKGCHQVDPLALASRKGVACPAQGQVREADIVKAFQRRDDHLHRLADYPVLIFGKGQVPEELQQAVHVHVEQLRDVLAPDLDVQRLRTQPRAMAGMAGSTAGEAAEHVLVLYLVAVVFHPFEEFVDPDQGILVSFLAAGVPDQVLYFLREIAVRREHGDAVAAGHLDEMLVEPSHLLSPPAGDGPVVEAFRLVRHHQVLADSYDLSEASADRTGPKRAVEREEVLIRLAESHAVQFEAVRILLHRTAVLEEEKLAVTFAEGGLHRRVEPRHQVIPFRCRPWLAVLSERHAVPERGQFQAVHQKIEGIRILIFPGELHHIFDLQHAVLAPEARKTLLLEAQHQFDLVVAA